MPFVGIDTDDAPCHMVLREHCISAGELLLDLFRLGIMLQRGIKSSLFLLEKVWTSYRSTYDFVGRVLFIFASYCFLVLRSVKSLNSSTCIHNSVFSILI